MFDWKDDGIFPYVSSEFLLVQHIPIAAVLSPHA